jgi:hypothetical protein
MPESFKIIILVHILLVHVYFKIYIIIRIVYINQTSLYYNIYIIYMHNLIYTPHNKVVGGYTGFTKILSAVYW